MSNTAGAGTSVPPPVVQGAIMGMTRSARYLTVRANTLVAITLPKNAVTFICLLRCLFL
jgi:hypothetical protein